MDEDVLGPRQTIIGERYDLCTRCGQPLPRDRVSAPALAGEGPSPLGDLPGAPRPLETTLDAPPPLLCPACTTEVAAGEPLDLDEDDERTST